MWNLITKTNPKFVTLFSFFKIKYVRKIEKIYMGSEKSMNSLEVKKRIEVT